MYDGTSGCTDEIDHSVLLVGAGSDNGKNYWLVKNSWGTGWGLKGYFKVARGKNACGVSRYNWFPKL